ncbi:MAG TPA: HYR domain-containing protein, partial [Anaeromyxobacter sp.]
ASIAIAYSLPKGTTFALGTTAVTATATDLGGNTGSCTFAVTVRDTTPPAVTCPADGVVEAAGPDGAVVSYAPATAVDAVTSAPAIAYAPADGSTLPLGTTTVTATATDGAGNTGSCTFAVTVRDTTPPAVTCPADGAVEATGPDGAVVSYAPATAVDAVTSTLTIVFSPADGSRLPLGTTSVTASATDGAGNTGSCAFAVTVADTTPPVITCPAAFAVEIPAGGAVTLPPATATDLADASPVVTSVPPSGAHLREGVTHVTYTAKDASGNAASCATDVTVTFRPDPGGGGCSCGSGGAGSLALLGAVAMLWPGRRRSRAR